MGAWDIGTFENDDAADWLYELEESDDIATVHAAFEAVTGNDSEPPEASDCACALAAAEIVAALRGHPLENLPDNALAWVDAHDGVDAAPLVPGALQAVERIRTESELKDLWEESGDAAPWYATLDDLTSRLNRP